MKGYKRILNVSFGKSGRGTISPKLSIPKSFLDQLGVNEQEREIIIQVIGDEITIRKKKNFEFSGKKIILKDKRDLFEYSDYELTETEIKEYFYILDKNNIVTCKKCGKEKSETEFGIRGNEIDKTCKECRKEQSEKSKMKRIQKRGY